MRLRAAMAASLLLVPLAVRADDVEAGVVVRVPFGIERAHPLAMPGADVHRTARTERRIPAAAPSRGLAVMVSDRAAVGPLLLADGSVVTGTSAGLEVRGPGGELRLSAATSAIDRVPVVMATGALFAVGRSGTAYVVDVEARRVIAERSLGAALRGSALPLDDGSVVLATGDRALWRLDATLGDVFRVELPDGAGSEPTLLASGRIAVGAGTSLHVVSIDGALERTIDLGARPIAAPAVADDGLVWVATNVGELVAIADERRVVRRVALGSQLYDGVGIAVARDGSVRVPVSGRGVVCIGPDGAERWVSGVDVPVQGPIVVDDEGASMTIDRRGRLIAIDPSGAQRWRVELGTYARGGAAMGTDAIVVVTDRGEIEWWR